MLKLSYCLFRIYVICYSLPSLIEVPYTDIFHVRLWLESSAAHTVGGIFGVRAPVKHLVLCPRLGARPVGSNENACGRELASISLQSSS